MRVSNTLAPSPLRASDSYCDRSPNHWAASAEAQPISAKGASRRPAAYAIALFLAGSCLCSCSTQSEPAIARAAVSGDVSLDGEPLKEGLVKFVPTGKTKGPATAIPIIDGHFSTDESIGPLVGSHRIEVVSTDDGGFPRDSEERLEQVTAMKSPPKIDVQIVPDVYREQTPLTAAVNQDARNHYRFDLTASRKKHR